MRAILVFALLLTLAACAKKEERPEPEPIPVGPVRDYQEYTRELMAGVPIDTERFKQSKYKAESYVTDVNHPLFFVELVISVEPVRLKDSITGKTQTYTRAQLTRPAGPAPGVMSMEEYRRQAQTAALNSRWFRVEMLP